jgi:chromate transporter
MNPPAVLAGLTAQLTLLSSISFGGFPTVLPDVHDFVVTAHGWMTDQDFANIFAMAQAIPGPNMILMMGLVGWKVMGLPGALACATATFAPPCAIYVTAFRLWERSRTTSWQRYVSAGLAPVTIGLVMASGVVMARAADTGWPAMALSIAAAVTLLTVRLNPIWLLAAGGVIGGLGWL